MNTSQARSVEVSQKEVEDARKKESLNQEGYLQNFLSSLKQKDLDINALTRTGNIQLNAIIMSTSTIVNGVPISCFITSSRTTHREYKFTK